MFHGCSAAARRIARLECYSALLASDAASFPVARALDVRTNDARDNFPISVSRGTQSPINNFGGLFSRLKFEFSEGLRLYQTDASVQSADRGELDDRYVESILKILKSGEVGESLDAALSRCSVDIHEDLVLQVLRRHRSNWRIALSFFRWAGKHPRFTHGPRTFNEMLDILGRMKRITEMRDLFDSVPQGTSTPVINDKTFAILMNRYAGAHKVQEAINVFYKRTHYGFPLDLVGFQILLMSLCRYKHVEDAEALFRQKANEFPPVIKTWNIILNGWCIKGSLLDTKRVWNEIISSKCERDLFTYSTFINSLAKSGKISTAVKLFATMWEKGIKPDVPICNCVIEGLCFKKRIPEALEIFGEMNERGCLPDVATYNSLIKHLCKIERLDKVYELLDDMERKDCVPNARTYSYILKTMDKPKDVDLLLQRMNKSGCKVDSDTYNLILNLYVGWGYEKGVKHIWREMERSGLGPDQRSFTIMIHGLHSVGKLDEALQYFKEMSLRGLIPEPRTVVLVKSIHMKKQEISDSSNSASEKHPLTK